VGDAGGLQRAVGLGVRALAQRIEGRTSPRIVRSSTRAARAPASRTSTCG
jgi:hypothetical protein